MEEDDPQLFCHPTWHWTLLVQPAAHHQRSIPGQETNGRGSKCPTQLLYEIFLLYLGLISHWHQHCQLGCNSGLSLPKGALRLKSHPGSWGWTSWEPQWPFWGCPVFLRLYFQAARFWNFLYSLWGLLHFAIQCCTSVHCLFSNALFS